MRAAEDEGGAPKPRPKRPPRKPREPEGPLEPKKLRAREEPGPKLDSAPKGEGKPNEVGGGGGGEAKPAPNPGTKRDEGAGEGGPKRVLLPPGAAETEEVGAEGAGAKVKRAKAGCGRPPRMASGMAGGWRGGSSLGGLLGTFGGADIFVFLSNKRKGKKVVAAGARG